MWLDLWFVEGTWIGSWIESDIQDTLYWAKKSYVISSAGKTQLFLFGHFSGFGTIDVKTCWVSYLWKYLLGC